MTVLDWNAILTRIGPHRPLDLDAALFAGGGGGAAALPTGDSPQPPANPPSMRLLHTRAPGRASIGIRLTVPIQDAAALAGHLAAMASEKGVDPIILAPFGPTGFETYGFRVERLPNDPMARAGAEAELAAFLGMAIVVDAGDILRLG